MQESEPKPKDKRETLKNIENHLKIDSAGTAEAEIGIRICLGIPMSSRSTLVEILWKDNKG